MKKIFFILTFALFLIGCVPDEQKIKIGAVLPLTGPASYVGEQTGNGMRMAVDEINAAGGINGKKIELIIEDSKTAPADGVTAYQKILDVDAPDVVISALSAVSMALAPVAKERETPLVGIMVTAPAFTTDNHWVFRYFPRAEDEVQVISTVLEDLNTTNLGILYMSDEYGTNVHNILKEQFENAGGTVHSETFGARDADFRTQITKLGAEGVEAIYIVGFDSHIKNIVKQLREIKFAGKILSTSTGSLPGVREDLGELSNGIYVVAPNIYAEELPENTQKFMSEYEKMFENKASHYAALGYDVIKLLQGTLSQENVRTALEQTSQHAGIFGETKIEQNEFSYPLHPAVIQDGKIVYLS